MKEGKFGGESTLTGLDFERIQNLIKSIPKKEYQIKQVKDYIFRTNY